ncbi:hypothetical protein PRZ61_10505 [Halomonas pacifica]|uniref:hypothetical protein n=1 Tax=Bisbaumannia pacifica TaxID=77098 RepID=UPI002359528D|nr:hypothetical protein [Halomonas pacifica]MDC8803866.1 hypothetical protein [Halomonas pacifica]
MNGDIIAFDDATQAGEIAASDGRRYLFDLSGWRGRGLPAAGQEVTFTPRDGQAVQVILRPVPQLRARAAQGEGEGERPRYSGWSLGGLLLAFLSLFLDGQVPLLAAAAAACAWWGLRQVQRDPARYRGRLFSWLAIALALLVAVLGALVAPSAAVPVS